MNIDSDINKLTELVIGCAYRVGRTLGSGFLEKVYENAMALELRKLGIPLEQQYPMKVIYSGEVVGEYIADLIVDSRLVVEIKSVRRLEQIHMAQCLNYLKATDLRLSLLINFGASSVEIKRIINGV
jgi:GxxExxY protein